MFFPTQVRAHHSGSRRMPTRWPANCSVSPGSCDSLERAPGLRRPGCSSGAAPSTRPRRPCTFSRTTASTTSTNNTAPRTHREYHEPVRGKSSPHPEGGGPPWMKTPHDEPRWSFSAGKCRNPDFVSEFQFRVGGVSVFQVRVGAQGACGEGSTRRRVWVSRMTYVTQTTAPRAIVLRTTQEICDACKDAVPIHPLPHPAARGPAVAGLPVASSPDGHGGSAGKRDSPRHW